MEYRVEQLAAACDVSVDTVRYYQSKRLLPAPRREGRVALYDEDHAARIRAIRSLQGKGLPLAVIRRALDGTLERGDADLAVAVVSEQIESDPDELLTLDELAARSGVPSPLLQAIVREGITIGLRVDGEERYTAADVEVVRQGLRLLEAGLPIGELLALAADYNAAARSAAERAVDLFDEHVRKPIRTSGRSDDEVARALVAAFRDLLPAVTTIVSHHFRRVLLSVAEEHIERVGISKKVSSPRKGSFPKKGPSGKGKRDRARTRTKGKRS